MAMPVLGGVTDTPTIGRAVGVIGAAESTFKAAA